eukprot:3322353-Amphidinium_carterae.2
MVMMMMMMSDGINDSEAYPVRTSWYRARCLVYTSLVTPHAGWANTKSSIVGIFCLTLTLIVLMILLLSLDSP